MTPRTPLAPVLTSALILALTGCPGETTSQEPDHDGDGFTQEQGDCNDQDASVHPAADEVCNAVDDDCDGSVDELFDYDGDGDTTCGTDGLPDTGDEDCDDTNALMNLDDKDGDGSSPCGGDCDDGDPFLNPTDADEDGYSTCDGDCDDGDEDLNIEDEDNDGYSTCGGDCNDHDPAMNLDDADGDGYSSCEEDCDDGNEAMNPADLDGDGWDTCHGDCDDSDDASYPGGTELACDGADNDCDPGTSDEPDEDADGHTACVDCDDHDPDLNLDDADADGVDTCSGDCDDGDATVLPGATELCDGIDNDCDGVLGGDELDADGDGVAICAGDCDDGDATVAPGLVEACDGLDNDCDGNLGWDEVDGDGDGWMVCGGDCDDGDSAVSPGITENCGNDIDDDCSGLVDAYDPSCVTLANGVTLITDTQVAAAVITDDDLTFPYSGNQDLLNLTSGDVIYSAYDTGFIRIVNTATAVPAQSPTEILVETGNGTFADLFDHAEFGFSFPAGGGPYNGMSGPHGITFSRDLGGNFATFADVTGSIASLEVTQGDLNFDTEIDGYCNEWLTLEGFWAQVVGQLDMQFEVEATFNQSFSAGAEIDIVDIPGPIILLGGVVPAQPVLTPYIGLSAEVEDQATLTLGVNVSSHVTLGVEYDNGWNSWSSDGFDVDPYSDAELDSGAVEFRGYVGLKLSVRLYGFVVPYFAIEPYLDLSIGWHPGCSWQNGVGVAGSLGVEIDIIGPWAVGLGELTLFEPYWTLASGYCGCDTYYADNDGDGFGDENGNGFFSCLPTYGQVANNSDCDDNAMDINPSAPEHCSDSIDNDCDNAIDGADLDCYLPPAACENGIDDDNDGWVDLGDPGCAGDPAGVDEGGYNGSYECNDGQDNDGNGLADADDANCIDAFDDLEGNPVLDDDGDGWEPPDDCDDGDPDVHPGANEDCNNGVDDDCDDNVDYDDDECVVPLAACENGADDDGDGWVDLDDPGCDYDPAGDDEGGYNGAFQCNDLSDNDGDGWIDEDDPDCADGYDDEGGVDFDGDGWSPPEDCDDGNPYMNPGEVEDCGNGMDDDCDAFGDCADSDCTGDPACLTWTTIYEQDFSNTNVFQEGVVGNQWFADGAEWWDAGLFSQLSYEAGYPDYGMGIHKEALGGAHGSLRLWIPAAATEDQLLRVTFWAYNPKVVDQEIEIGRAAWGIDQVVTIPAQTWTQFQLELEATGYSSTLAIRVGAIEWDPGVYDLIIDEIVVERS